MIQSRQRFSDGEPERSPPDLIYVDTSTLDSSERQMDGSRFIKSASIQRNRRRRGLQISDYFPHKYLLILTLIKRNRGIIIHGTTGERRGFTV